MIDFRLLALFTLRQFAQLNPARTVAVVLAENCLPLRDSCASQHSTFTIQATLTRGITVFKLVPKYESNDQFVKG